MNYSREKVVTKIISWIGRKESDGSHKLIVDIYNSHRPRPRGYKVKYTDAWCAATVSAVSIDLGYEAIIPIECSCNEMIKKLKAIGAWQEKDSHVPSPGDILFYDWQDSGVGDNTGSSDHVGIVEKIVGTKITVIEGNYNNSVKRRVIGVNSKQIRGYGVPKYTEKKTETVTTNNKLTAKESAKHRDNTLAGTYTVMASSLHMRDGAGTNKKSLVTIPNGKTVKNYGYYTKTSSGTKWLYVQFTANGVTYTGFCSEKYLKKKG